MQDLVFIACYTAIPIKLMVSIVTIETQFNSFFHLFQESNMEIVKLQPIITSSLPISQNVPSKIPEQFSTLCRTILQKPDPIVITIEDDEDEPKPVGKKLLRYIFNYSSPLTFILVEPPKFPCETRHELPNTSSHPQTSSSAITESDVQEILEKTLNSSWQCASMANSQDLKNSFENLVEPPKFPCETRHELPNTSSHPQTSSSTITESDVQEILEKALSSSWQCASMVKSEDLKNSFENLVYL